MRTCAQPLAHKPCRSARSASALTMPASTATSSLPVDTTSHTDKTTLSNLNCSNMSATIPSVQITPAMDVPVASNVRSSSKMRSSSSSGRSTVRSNSSSSPSSPVQKRVRRISSQGYHSCSDLSISPVLTPLLVVSPVASPSASSSDADPASSSTEEDRWSSNSPMSSPSAASSSCGDGDGSSSFDATSPPKTTVFRDPFSGSRKVPLPEEESLYRHSDMRDNRFGLFDVDKAFPCTTADPCLLDAMLIREKEAHCRDMQLARQKMKAAKEDALKKYNLDALKKHNQDAFMKHKEAAMKKHQEDALKNHKEDALKKQRADRLFYRSARFVDADV